MAAGPRGGGPLRLPPTAPGLRVGLYGGSFDPPHPGHRHVAMLAMRRLGLDRVWWIVGPGNPLKDRRRLPSSAERLSAARAVARHPRMVATDFEARLGARYTVQTVRYLVRRCPDVRFVLVIGADSFATLQRWRAWREIAALVPVAVVDRPGWTLKAQTGKAATLFRRDRLGGGSARLLADATPPAWCFLTGPRSNLSSTRIRDKLLKTLDRR